MLIVIIITIYVIFALCSAQSSAFPRTTIWAFVKLSIFFALLTLLQFSVISIAFCVCVFGIPKPLFWHWIGKTYLAHLLQCVFWLALLSMDGMSAKGRENRGTDRQTEREREREQAGESLHSDSEGR